MSQSSYQSAYKSRSLGSPSLKERRKQTNGSRRKSTNNQRLIANETDIEATQSTLDQESNMQSRDAAIISAIAALPSYYFDHYSRSKHVWRNHRFYYQSRVQWSTGSCLCNYTTSCSWFWYQKNLHYRKQRNRRCSNLCSCCKILMN